ncbi:membrane protein insertase YidC [Streptosporangiaceae bacterium NEAU-GS5]|nr:membrane protein insertase YidC [Streptosporangiaceae bacterium NEAU-GS5]
MFDFVLDPAYQLIYAVSAHTGPLLAIVAFTVAVRLLLLPLSIRQSRSVKGRLRLKPQVDRLRARHSRDPARLVREINDLYAEEGTSQFAGIGPAIAQAPFLTILYRLFVSATIAGHANLLLAQGVLGVPLGEHLAAVVANPPALAVYLVLLALIAVVAWQASRLMGRMDASSGRLVRLMPYGTVAMAALLPFAAGIYLLISTTWTTVERAVLYAA